jgi:hypothetical protein
MKIIGSVSFLRKNDMKIIIGGALLIENPLQIVAQGVQKEGREPLS